MLAIYAKETLDKTQTIIRYNESYTYTLLPTNQGKPFLVIENFVSKIAYINIFK